MMKRFGRSLILALAPAVGAQAITINEINYDNDGTDNREYVELYHEGGGDFTGYELVLYNGSSTIRAPYRRIALGVIPADGYLVIGVADTPNVDILFPGATNQIENGAPDGIAIVQTGLACVEALGYEGSFAGHSTNGAECADVTFTDIGVSDVDPADALGEVVLQRLPNGTGAFEATTDGVDAGIYADGTPGRMNIPEPATLLLMVVGAGTFGLRRSAR